MRKAAKRAMTPSAPCTQTPPLLGPRRNRPRLRARVAITSPLTPKCLPSGRAQARLFLTSSWHARCRSTAGAGAFTPSEALTITSDTFVVMAAGFNGMMTLLSLQCALFRASSLLTQSEQWLSRARTSVGPLGRSERSRPHRTFEYPRLVPSLPLELARRRMYLPASSRSSRASPRR